MKEVQRKDLKEGQFYYDINEEHDSNKLEYVGIINSEEDNIEVRGFKSSHDYYDKNSEGIIEFEIEGSCFYEK